MNKKFLNLVFAIVLLMSAMPLLARENETVEPTEVEIEATKEPSPTKAEAENKNKKEDKEKKMMEKETIRKKMEDQKEMLKKKREEIKAELELKKEELKASMSATREEFKSKMEEFRDEQKKEVVEKLDQRINDINATKTASLLEKLNRLTSVLDKMESRMNAQALNSQALTSAILEARNAIAKAKSDVENQAAKNYVIQISSESGVRSDVSALIKNMKTDLQTAVESVRNAKKSVQAVHEALKQMRKLSITPVTSAEPSTTITPDVELSPSPTVTNMP